MTNLILDAIKFLYQGYSEKQRKDATATHLRQAVLREISLNLEIIKEANNLQSTEPDKSKKLVENTELDAFKAVEALGIPIEIIFGGKTWSNDSAHAKQFQKGKFKQYTENIKMISDLIERTYHRLRIHQLRVKLGIEKRQPSTEYLEALLLESKEAIRSMTPANK
ncbi:hypothetical protein [Desulfobulbus alkaliphilus]|uniref:hypothetical protein n=1 Tax=Desulfobulbus alkaliphilus TaxID=869814 RepID=UPI0019639CC6|nr:hypothetical protein [Desulfobulbus alkaliphilus]MBM9538604.1 hypothetical protein [Desulfobulbus alkaliphilus]